MDDRILFIGPIAEQGGPAIKNRILIKYLERSASLDIWNTYDKTVQKRIGAIFSILFTKNKYLIIAVSRKGRMLLYPFLALKKKMSGIHFACIVIGGNAVESFKTKASIHALVQADIVALETKGLVNEFIETFGLENTYWLPNYKELPKDRAYLNERSCLNERERFKEPDLKFLFLSSMRNAKGIATLLKAFQTVLNDGYNATLDFYGPIKKDLDPQLLDMINNTEHVQYCGVADNSKILEIMSKYDVFVFPTEYKGEGFPAVLVEAQAAGLPVIASDMNFNPEIIGDRINGWIFEHGDEKQLTDRIKYCLDHREELVQISRNNTRNAANYDADTVIERFKKELRSFGWPL